MQAFSKLPSTALLAFAGLSAISGSVAAQESPKLDITNSPLPNVSVDSVSVNGANDLVQAAPRYYYYPSFRYNADTRSLSPQPNLNFVPTFAQPTTVPTATAPLTTPSVSVAPAFQRFVRPASNLYVSGKIALNEAHDVYYDALTTSPYSASTSFDQGYAGTIALGTFLNAPSLVMSNTTSILSPRVEVELGLRSIDVDKTGFIGSGTGDGSATTLSGMVNLYNDLNFGNLSASLGGGVGLAQVDFDGIRSGLASDPTDVDGDPNSWAFQGMAGLGFQVTPSTKIMLEVRRFGIRDLEYTAADGSTTETLFRTNEAGLGFLTRF